MELFKDMHFDFLGRKWWFILPSLILTLAGLASLLVKGGPLYSIDFRGGAVMDVRHGCRIDVRHGQLVANPFLARIDGDAGGPAGVGIARPGNFGGAGQGRVQFDSALGSTGDGGCGDQRGGGSERQCEREFVGHDRTPKLRFSWTANG